MRAAVHGASPSGSDAVTGRRLAVSHPGATPLVYNLVATLQRQGNSVAFHTGAYYTPGLQRAAATLPRALRAPAERLLGRRRHADIDPAGVCLHPAWEVAYLAVARLGAPRAVARGLLHRRNRAFDRAVAEAVGKGDFAALIGHDGSSLHSFRAARAARCRTVLNQVTGHLAAARRLLEEEARRHPEFADSLEVDAGGNWLERCQREALEAEMVLAPSAYVRDTLEAEGVPAERIALLPYGVDAGRFRPAEAPRHDDDTFRVLYVGNISQRKGIKYLLEAVRRLDLPELRLTLVGGVVGSGRGLAPYRPWFRHVPHVPHGEVDRLYREADVFVYPSLHEGSALAIFEALASGLPVVTTPNAGSVLRDGEEGFIVPIRDVEALMDRLSRLREDAALRRRMAARARQTALDYTWQRYGERLHGILDDLLASSSP